MSAHASALALIAGVVSSATAADTASEFPPGPGQREVQAACAPCHEITVVTAARKSEPEWASTVDAMITRGAQVPDADYEAIVAYLASMFSAP